MVCLWYGVTAIARGNGIEGLGFTPNRILTTIAYGGNVRRKKGKLPFCLRSKISIRAPPSFCWASSQSVDCALSGARFQRTWFGVVEMVFYLFR